MSQTVGPVLLAVAEPHWQYFEKCSLAPAAATNFRVGQFPMSAGQDVTHCDTRDLSLQTDSEQSEHADAEAYKSFVANFMHKRICT